jgi:hypothetical protein
VLSLVQTMSIFCGFTPQLTKRARERGNDEVVGVAGVYDLSSPIFDFLRCRRSYTKRGNIQMPRELIKKTFSPIVTYKISLSEVVLKTEDIQQRESF